LTPFFTAVIPSHDYVYLAHAAAGRDLHQYLLGFNLGGRLDRLLPGSPTARSPSFWTPAARPRPFSWTRWALCATTGASPRDLVTGLEERPGVFSRRPTHPTRRDQGLRLRDPAKVAAVRLNRRAQHGIAPFVMRNSVL